MEIWPNVENIWFHCVYIGDYYTQHTFRVSSRLYTYALPQLALKLHLLGTPNIVAILTRQVSSEGRLSRWPNAETLPNSMIIDARLAWHAHWSPSSQSQFSSHSPQFATWRKRNPL